MAKDKDSPSAHDAVLDAARAIVLEDGRHLLSMRRVAKRAGVSVGTVQYYFPNLEALVDAITDPWHDGLEAILKETAIALPLSSDRTALLVEMCLRIFRLARQHREFILTRRLDTLGRGALLERRRSPALRWLKRGTIQMARFLGGKPQDWQLLVLAVEFLITGFVLTERTDELEATDEEIEAFLRRSIEALGVAVVSKG